MQLQTNMLIHSAYFCLFLCIHKYIIILIIIINYYYYIYENYIFSALIKNNKLGIIIAKQQQWDSWNCLKEQYNSIGDNNNNRSTSNNNSKVSSSSSSSRGHSP